MFKKILKNRAVLFLLFSSPAIAGRTQMLMRGHVYHDEKLKTVRIMSNIKNPYTNEFIVDKEVVITRDSFLLSLPLWEPQELFLTYGENEHQFFVYPTDTMDLTILKNPKPDTIYYNSSITQFRYEKITIEGKNKAVNSFFENLRKDLRTDLLIPYTLKPGSKDLAAYVSQLTLIDTARNHYLSDFIEHHGLLRNSAFELAVRNDFAGNLLNSTVSAGIQTNTNPYMLIAQFPGLDDSIFNWESCRNSRVLMSAARNYYKFVVSDVFRTKNNTLESAFSKSYYAIDSSVKDDSLRAYLLTEVMREFLEKKPSNYQAILERYKRDCLNPVFVSKIVSQSTEQTQAFSRPIPASVLTKTILVDVTTQKRISLYDLLKNTDHPKLIDFWATYCVPCVREFKYMNKYEKLYADKIDFIKISLDNDLKKIIKLQTAAKVSGNTFYVLGGIKSPISQYINLAGPPRYLSLENDNRIHKSICPFPSSESLFQNELNELIHQP